MSVCSPLRGGYPIPGLAWGGVTPCQVWLQGYPILGLVGGTQGNPLTRSGWGTPADLGWGPPRPGMGYPPQTWDGVPSSPWTWDGIPPHNGEKTDIPKYKYYLPSYYPGLAGGVPHPRFGRGYPGYPLTRSGWGTPPDLGWGPPGPGMGYPSRPGMGYPPQHSEHLIRGGRYASCVHAGGLSCDD